MGFSLFSVRILFVSLYFSKGMVTHPSLLGLMKGRPMMRYTFDGMEKGNMGNDGICDG